MNKQDILSALTPEIVQNFKTAIELGKWPDGRKLSAEQKQTCMQAVVVWEHEHCDETQKTGYVPPKQTPCAPDDEDTVNLVKFN